MIFDQQLRYNQLEIFFKEFRIKKIISIFILCTLFSFIKSNKSSGDDIINLSNYKYPNNSNTEKDEFILAILGTNDIHGQAYERDFKLNNDTYKVGGYKLLSGVIRMIREEFKDQFLWLDAGDQFTGTVENIRTNGELMLDFYNALRVDSATIGNHEWDNKEAQLRKWMASELGRYYNIENSFFNNLNPLNQNSKKNNLLFLISNLELKENFNKTDDLPNKMPTKIFEFLNGKIKIGVIGLTTQETNEKTAGFSNNKFNLLPYKPIVESLSKELKAKGATAVLILSHVGMSCKSPGFTPDQLDEYYSLALRDKSYYSPTSKIQNPCRGELYDLLNSLETGTIQGVISGHVHESIHHFINGIPTIQNPMSNIFTNVMYLKFKKDQNGNYHFKNDDILIEGPIPLCSKIFSNNLRCNIYQDLSEKVKLSEFSFHGGKFEVDPFVEKVFSKYKELNDQINKMKEHIIFTTQIRLERSSLEENILGNLIADVYRKSTNADIGMVAPGNLRYIWERGQVTEYEFQNMFPFGGNFGRYNVTGKNLKLIFKTLQEGKSGFYSFSGVNMTILRSNATSARLDTDSVKLFSGEEIIDDKLYSFASNEFMLTGGDDMKNFKVNGIMTINSTEIEMSTPILYGFDSYLRELEVLKEEDAYKYLGRITIKNINSLNILLSK